MSKKSSARSKTNFVIRKMWIAFAGDDYLREECRRMVGVIAGSRGLQEDRPAMFTRVSVLSGLTAASVASYWYKKIQRPYGSDIAKLAAAAESARRRRETEQRLASEIEALAQHHNAKRAEFTARAPRWLAALAAPAMAEAADEDAAEIAPRRAAGGRR